MAIALYKVDTPQQLLIVEQMATEIWQQHFTSIIGPEQVAYMLQRFQTASAISAQIESGAEYYLVTSETENVGYFCVIADTRSQRMMLSKLYIQQKRRCNGIGSAVIDYAVAQCAEASCRTLWLTVNRHNHATIEWYKRRGFIIVDEVIADIGAGFYMDDYLMEKQTKQLQ